MNILDNELVLKYFGCRSLCTEAHFTNMPYDEHERCMSCRILDAMQQPILKWERYLWIDKYSNVSEGVAWVGYGDMEIHPDCLRLPDAFQKHGGVHFIYCQDCGAAIEHSTKPAPSPEKCEGEHNGKSCPELHPEPKDAVEEKIDFIVGLTAYNPKSGADIEKELRDLVRLARETK